MRDDKESTNCSTLASDDHRSWKSRWYGRVPLTITLASAIGLLVFLTAGTVLGVGAWIAQKNTFALISANAHQAISSDVSQLEQHLRPAEHQVRFISHAIERGDIDPNDREAFGLVLTGALAAAPQIEALIFMDANLQAFSAGRNPGSPSIKLQQADRSNDLNISNTRDLVKQAPIWLPPVWREEQQRTFLSRAHRVKINGNYVGAIIAVVSVEHLSNFISIQSIGQVGNRFILYGRQHILAHWILANGFPGRSSDNPLPALSSFSDPILSTIWDQDDHVEPIYTLPEGTFGHVIKRFNETYAFVYREIEGFGSEPLIIGSYFQASDFSEEVGRLFASLLVGLLAVFISLLAAIYLGRRIAKPIVQYSNAASQIRALEVSKVQPLKGSAFKELNDQSMAFNSMLRALRWFEMYVPKKIVKQLIRNDNLDSTLSDAREVTVLFTDVVGFSSVSEGMSATELASFVNHHFKLVVQCIEAENGIVDKFMGDAVMAFWGASEEQAHSVDDACRAAIGIAKSIHQDNLCRVQQGEAPIGIRIGIHTGIATVGNIGAPGRLNYTIIGDTVNIGQRLEQLGKEVYPAGTEISVLVSGDTAALSQGDFNLQPTGRYRLKGRSSEVDVYKLIPDLD